VPAPDALSAPAAWGRTSEDHRLGRAEARQRLDRALGQVQRVADARGLGGLYAQDDVPHLMPSLGSSETVSWDVVTGVQ